MGRKLQPQPGISSKTLRRQFGRFYDQKKVGNIEGLAGKNQAYANLSQDWARGTREFKADLVRDYQVAARKSAAWKVAVATYLKSTTDVSNGWLASQLDGGIAAYVSKHVGLLQRHGRPAKRWLDQLKKVNGET